MHLGGVALVLNDRAVFFGIFVDILVKMWKQLAKESA
jgi:hypothetical protein